LPDARRSSPNLRKSLLEFARHPGRRLSLSGPSREEAVFCPPRLLSEATPDLVRRLLRTHSRHTCLYTLLAPFFPPESFNRASGNTAIQSARPHGAPTLTLISRDSTGFLFPKIPPSPIPSPPSPLPVYKVPVSRHGEPSPPPLSKTLFFPDFNFGTGPDPFLPSVFIQKHVLLAPILRRGTNQPEVQTPPPFLAFLPPPPSDR